MAGNSSSQRQKGRGGEVTRKQNKKQLSNRRLNLLAQVQRNSKIQNRAESEGDGTDKAIFESLALQCDCRNAVHTEPSEPDDSRVSNAGLRVASSQTKRAFGVHLRKAIQESDVIIEVLDARDPNGFRSLKIEEEIISLGKKLILLLNKVDLVADPTIVAEWEKHLRQTHPTVCFRSMTTSSRSKKSSSKHSTGKVTQQPVGKLACGYEAAGAGELMNLLKNYTRTDQERTHSDSAVDDDHMVDGSIGGDGAEMNGVSLTKPLYKNIVVGIIGMPNVGKSSTINSLCRNSNRVRTGNIAGVTRDITRIRLTKNIQLLDTPGIILEEMDPALLILRGCVKTYGGADAENAVELLRRTPGVVPELIRLYDVDYAVCVQEQDVRSLLYEISHKRKLFLKGGVANVEGAARLVLEDWRNGYFRNVQARPPPDTPEKGPAAHGNIQIMKGPSKAIEF